MSSSNDSDTDRLMKLAAEGNHSARDQLLNLHRSRLRKAIELRMDRRLASRFDPSDVVQETLAEASARLSEFLVERPLPLYPWLRRMAAQKMADMHRRHVRAGRRSVCREEPSAVVLPDRSARQLVRQLMHSGATPSESLVQKEQQERVRRALAALDPKEREVLILRSLEQLSTRDTAAVLAISVEAARSRHRRALEKLSDSLSDLLSGDSA